MVSNSSNPADDAATGDVPYASPQATSKTWQPLVVSLLLHSLLIFVLAMLVRTTVLEANSIVSSQFFDESLPNEYTFESIALKTVGAETDQNSTDPAEESAKALVSDPSLERIKTLELNDLESEQPNEKEKSPSTDTENVSTYAATGVTMHPGGISGAVDRLTHEIATSLKEQDTLVIWLFDASLSLNARRNTISQRFEKVYRELGQLDVGTDSSLLSAVAGFGQRLSIMTPQPTADVKKLTAAVRNIKPDSSGFENVFSSVGAVAKRWKTYRTKKKYNVMIIVVTDERGDDYKKLEKLSRFLKRYGMRFYCVGNAAVFGREKGFLSFTDQRGFRWSRVPVDQGPETVAPERLKLPFWGGGGQDLETMTASFGPYALSRLCADTGGLYLVVAESRRGPRFDPEVMKNYEPEYSSIKLYQTKLNRNRAKSALVTTAMSMKLNSIPQPRRAFRADRVDVLRRQITEAQKPLAVLDPQLRAMHDTLSSGQKHRSKLDTPRWRASYDLAIGRVIAMRVRIFGYNVILAEMKTNPRPFRNKQNNQWRLVPSKVVQAPPKIKKWASLAEEYLTRVVEEHPGTPWAIIAERELSKPLGWSWQEARMKIPKPRPPGSGSPSRPTRRPPPRRGPQRGPQPKL